MTDQTQTTTEPVAWRYRSGSAEEHWKLSLTPIYVDPKWAVEVQPLYTTPQPLAIGLDRDNLAEGLFTADRIRKRVTPDWIGLPRDHKDEWLAKADAIRAAQQSVSVEALIAEARTNLPHAGPEAIARHLYTYLAANPDMSNALCLIQGLKDVIGRERTEQSRIMGDFKDAAPGAAAVAAHDSFLRANPHLNESDPNVRT